MMRILVITHSPPWPPSTGTTQRTNLLIRALSRQGHVDLVLTPKSVKAYTPEIVDRLRREFGLIALMQPRARGRYGPWSVFRPVAPRWVDAAATLLGRADVAYFPDRVISHWLGDRVAAHRYDVIVGRYLGPTALSGALAYGPVVLDVDDLDTEHCRTQLAVPGTYWWVRWNVRRRLRRLEGIVPESLRRPAHLWVCTEADRVLVGPDRATVLPNIPFVSEHGAPIAPCGAAPQSNRLLMVASLKYEVNERAVDRFVQRAWPAVRNACPSAAFRIVGAGMSSRQRARWARVDGVQPVGYVPDLKEEYANAAFTVVPIFEGSGTKIKVLESLAYARACVLARHSQRGFEEVLRHREALWCADDDDGLAAGCIHLLHDAALRDRMAERGHRLVSERFTFEVFERIVAQTLTDVLRKNPSHVQRVR